MKFLIYFLTICVLVLGLGLDLEAQKGSKIRTVVIDAGHGGKDPGAIGKNSKEKHIALAVALQTGKYIEKYLPDVKVIYTRKDDRFIPLHTRAAIANVNNVFVTCTHKQTVFRLLPRALIFHQNKVIIYMEAVNDKTG